MERIETKIGDIYIDTTTSESELLLLDSNTNFFARFDKLDESDIRNKLEELETLKDLLTLSFCRDISYTPIFDSENGIDEINLGNKKVYLIW
jgi:hypothetical protein